MGHQLENANDMLYVGDTPWHGLGVALDKPPTVEEAIVAANLDWEVRTTPAGSFLPPLELPCDAAQVREDAWMRAHGGPANEHLGLVWTPNEGRTVYRSDTNRVLGRVGSKWKPLQNRDAFHWFNRWIDTGKVEIETAGALKGGERVWILAKIVGDPLRIKGDDVANKYILITHSHDGKTSIRAGFTAIRVVCANTLGWAISISDKEGNSVPELFRVTHTARALERLEDVANKIDEADSRLNKAGELYRELTRREVQNDQEIERFVACVFEKPLDGIKDGRMLDRIKVNFESGVGQDLDGAKGTMWGLYNALTQDLTHGHGKTAKRRDRQENRALRNSGTAKRLHRGLDVAVAMARNYTLEEVFGQWADICSIADAANPASELVKHEQREEARGRAVA